ncbi:MAG TPA: hypothetical protein PLW99_02875 [Candidatus Paceibacterota bacterium]|nr:MAG: hypothetical protein B7X03_00775 [Parcubacteria group bacterium 21-58-10]HQT83065.1 hypothetical protein [Candidatus Paceibacterota bacterium]
MDINQTNALAALAGCRGAALRAVPSNELAQLLQGILVLGDVKVGALPDLTGFTPDVAHVIYFVKELGRNGQDETIGLCVCLIIKSNGSVRYETSDRLDAFWPIWQSESRTSLGSVPNVLNEIRHFFEHHGSLKTPRAYYFRDGHANSRLHRFQRSQEKCRQLKLVFGYCLTAADL